MAKGKKNNLVSKLVEQQIEREKLFRSTADRLRSPYTASFASSGLSSMAEEMSRVREQLISPLSSIQQMLDSFREPVRAFQSLIPDIQPWVNSYQPAIDTINNSGLTALLKSFSEVYEPITTMKAFQNNFVLPDFRVHTELWENISDDDIDLQEATSILEEIKGENQRPDVAIERLSDLVEKMLVESDKEEINSFTKWQKVQVLMWIIGLIFPVVISIYITNNANNESEKAISRLTHIVETVTEKHKETTANLRLRTEPNTSDSKNILLVIPKGTIVIVDKSISYWSKVMFTDEKGFVRSGWVSKRYLANVD
tara:strand:+ start:1543 stop:2478 length:936 start_codon:yes stop_codon:yes gene_type:complete